jgi:hypothetical protein
MVNGQPFFFPDTTSYVRAADIAVNLASGGRIRTAWTERYASTLPALAQTRRPASHATIAPKTARFGNDISSGSIMSGRSPYFGAALYLGYVTSDFWLFVVAYGLSAYLLIALSLRAFALEGKRARLLAVAFVAAFTTAPFYNAYLLADALAAQGILAFLLLAIKGRAFRRRELIFLLAIILASVVSHLTHILIILAMALATALLPLLGLLRRRTARFAAGVGVAMAVLGMVSTMLTAAVVSNVFGKPPSLVPLLTARFIDDGPGARYIREHCDDNAFAVCAFAGRMSLHSGEFLWSPVPGKGVFLVADESTRLALSEQDKQFALAVLRTYPVDQTKMILYNTISQAVSFESYALNYGCWADPHCWTSVPTVERDKMRHTLSGRNLWPTTFLTVLQYTVVIGSVLLLAAIATASWRTRQQTEPFATGERWRLDAGAWIVLATLALLLNAFLGGSISEPQSRYQARVIWLLPYMAWLFSAVWYRQRRHQFSEAPAT